MPSMFMAMAVDTSSAAVSGLPFRSRAALLARLAEVGWPKVEQFRVTARDEFQSGKDTALPGPVAGQRVVRPTLESVCPHIEEGL